MLTMVQLLRWRKQIVTCITPSICSREMKVHLGLGRKSVLQWIMGVVLVGPGTR